MHRVARLEADDRLPAALGERLTARGRRKGQLRKRAHRRLQQPDIAAQQHRPLGVQPRHAGVLLRGGAIHLLGLVALIVGVALAQLQQADQPAIGGVQANRLAIAQHLGARLAHRQRDRDRPERAVGQAHLVHNARVVGLAQEAGSGL